MDSRSNNITSGQLMALVVSMQLGISVLNLPGPLSRVCGHDGWISILVYGIVTTGVIILIVRLMNRYNNQSIYEINKLLYGKYLGSLLNLFIVLYLWYSSCLYLRSYLNIVHVHLLRSTPSLILCGFILIPTCYLSWYGLKYIARFSTMIYLSLTACLVLFFLVYKNLRLTFLMPIGQSGIRGIKESLPLYLCIFGL